MENLMNKEVFSLLESWAEIDKNKEHPAQHPDDEGRWLEFVVTAFREGARHQDVRDELAGWLMEKKGWMEPQAEGMAKRYGEAIAVLEAYAGQ